MSRAAATLGVGLLGGDPATSPRGLRRLNHLRPFPIDELTIDSPFVASLDDGPPQSAVVRHLA